MNNNTEDSFKFKQRIKTIFDCIIAVVFLIPVLPFIGLIALAIKLDSRGEVIYRHKRIGKDGKPFVLYKFRSMVKGGDDAGYLNYLQELIESERDGNSQGLPYRKMDADWRVTRVGKLLRRFYLDEVPQVLNILRGEMSWVGPRPHVEFEVINYTEQQRRRLIVKPGLTGLWQVKGKGDCTFSELLQLDLDYIDQWRLSLDIKILVDTFLIMLRGGEESWARKVKRVPARRAAFSYRGLFTRSLNRDPSGGRQAENQFIEVPIPKKEYADEHR
jgi:lipopolysaccharide/colanic/teichoic acid biosynthesis glycosyltransferase